MIKRTIFVTGSSGFIGKNFVEQYTHKYKLLTPTHNQLDLLDPRSVDRYFSKNKIDVVLHLANKGGNQKEAAYSAPLSANLRIFFNIVRNQDKFNKMIYVGSGAEYAKQNPIVKVKESDFGRNIPVDDFGLYKFIVAKYIEESKNVVNLRAFGVYGKYEDWQYKFISNSICCALYGKQIDVLNNCVFDYIYINDLLTIIDYFIDHNAKFNSYNVGSKNHQELASIARMIAEISGQNIRVNVKNRSLGLEYTCNNNRLVGEIKNINWTPIEKSLQELMLWYGKNLAKVDKNRLHPQRREIWRP